MRFFTAVVAVLAVATGVGLVVLWPGHVETTQAEGFVDTQRGEVRRVEERLCPNFTEQKCQLATVRLESGRTPARTCVSGSIRAAAWIRTLTPGTRSVSPGAQTSAPGPRRSRVPATR
jgi:hypothetical protein